MKKNNFMSIIISHLSFLLFFVCDMIVSQCDSVIKFVYMLMSPWLRDKVGIV